MSLQKNHLIFSTHLFLLFLLKLLTANQERIQKISDINVLLPICESSNCNNVYYSVYAEGGCYEWSVDQPELLDLKQVSKEEDYHSKISSSKCFSKAIISPINTARLSGQIVWLIARDKKSNVQFKCKVGFSKITKLEITKKFSRMNVGEISKIDVDAYDSQHNLFSSLKGYRFHWKISDGSSVHLLKLSQEKVKVGEERLEVEKKYHSDVILLSGISTGKVKLIAELVEPDYEDILSKERLLYITQPFTIYPSDPVYILPEDKFNFDLEFETGKLTSKDDQKYYSWSLMSNTDLCGSLERGTFGGYISPKRICNTTITATDNRIDKFNTASNMIHVVKPTGLDMMVLEITKNEADYIFLTSNNQEISSKFKKFESQANRENRIYDNSNSIKLIENRYYIIKNVLMHERYPIRIDNSNINFIVKSKGLEQAASIEKLNCFHNNEICLYKTLKPIEEYVEIESVVNSGDKLYNIIKNIRIFTEVKIEKFGVSMFSLPYLGENDNSNSNNNIETSIRSQELRLIVNGGTGSYLFTSDNTDIIQIRHEILYGKNMGKTRVKVTDSEIPSNFDLVDVEIREVKEIGFLEERQEIKVGDEYYISPVAKKSDSKADDEENYNVYVGNVFTNCTNLELLYKGGDSNSDNAISSDSFKAATSNNYKSVQDLFKNRNRNKNLNIYDSDFQLSLSKAKLNISGVQENTLQHKYLNYTNFGVCGSIKALAYKEGLRKTIVEAKLINQNIMGNTNTSIKTKISSSLSAKVYVYSQLSLTSPIITDTFTKEMIRKSELAINSSTFILTIGSSMKIKLDNGIIPWVNFESDYTESTYIVNNVNNSSSTLSTEAISDIASIKFTSNKELSVECLSHSKSEKNINIIIANKKNKSLPRPAKSTFSLTIGCFYPKSLSLFILNGGVDSTQSIFGVPQKSAIEYYERRDSTKTLRVYGFDEKLRMFYNISSIKGEWLSEDKSNITDIYKNYPEFIESSIHFSDMVKRFELNYISNTPTKTSQNAIINLVDYPILSITNKTIYLPPVNTTETINISKGSGDFEIALSDYSLAKLEYDITNRDIIIYPQKEGVLYIYLRDKRINHVNYLDNKNINSYSSEQSASASASYRAHATAVVRISHIKKIELIGGGLLMINNTNSIGLNVYDNHGNLFSFDQIKKMNLVLESFSNGLEISDVLPGETAMDKTAIPIAIARYLVKGLSADTYNLVIYDSYSNITSNTVRIENFEKLEVFPPYLLMIPGSSYTLTIRGGPINEQHVVKKYEMVNKEIATVGSSEPEVKAHIQGKTVLRLTLTLNPDYNKFYISNGNSNKNLNNRSKPTLYTLATVEVPVKVDFPDHISIRGAVNRKIYTKSTVRLYAALKLGDETFTYGVGPLSFDWALDNTLIAKLRFYKSKPEKESLCSHIDTSSSDKSPKQCNSPIMSHQNLDPYNSLGVFLSTSANGAVNIKLTVTIKYPDPYKWHRPYIFTKEEKITILDETYVKIPEFYEDIPNKSGLYIIPQNIDHELHTNKNNNNAKYSVISQHTTQQSQELSLPELSLLNLNEYGRITSFSQTGVVHILINQKEKDSPAYIPVVLPVLITDYHSLFAGRSYQLIDMEVGHEVTLKIVLQHEYGLLFADGKFERLPLRVVESHPRVVKAELTEMNSMIKIRANSKGDSNIIIFDPSTMNILDVFQVSVYSSLILPEKIYLNLGAEVNFLKKDEKRKLHLSQDSEWISDDTGVIKIDPIDGKAIAVGLGSTNIHLISKDRSKVKLTTNVHVNKIHNINIDRSAIPQFMTDIITSKYYQREYHIPLTFYIYDGIQLSNDADDMLNEIKQNLNIKCQSGNTEIFASEANLNSNSNSNSNSDRKNPICNIKIRDLPFDLIAPNNLKLIISAESHHNLSKDTFSATFKFPFISSFRIKNKPTHMIFTKQNRTQTIYVDNLNDVSVEVQDESLVKVEVSGETSYEDGDWPYVKLYVPHHVSSNFDDIKLTLNNRITNQKEEILISYQHVEETEGGLFSRSNIVDFITFLMLLTSIVVMYNYMTSPSEERRRIVAGPNISASRPPQGSGVTSAFSMNK